MSSMHWMRISIRANRSSSSRGAADIGVEEFAEPRRIGHLVLPVLAERVVR
jgi:hypothetical protein